MDGYIGFDLARSTQRDELVAAVPWLLDQLGGDDARRMMRGAGPVFLAMGASLAAVGAATWTLRSRGVDAWRLGAGDTPIPLPDDARTVIALSQSGRSTETLAAFLSVPAERRFCVVNTVPSPLSDASTGCLDLGGIADSYASTIGYTLTVLAGALIAETWDGGSPSPVWTGLGDLVAAAETTPLDGAVAAFDDVPWADVVGGGASAGSAEAGALLLRETARVAASAFSTRQYLHGAMESAGDGVHLLFGAERERDLAVMLAEAGHRVVVVGELAVEAAGVVSVVLPPCGDGARPILEAIVLQRLVAGIAPRRGVDIEQFVFHHDDTKVDSGSAAA